MLRREQNDRDDSGGAEGGRPTIEQRGIGDRLSLSDRILLAQRDGGVKLPESSQPRTSSTPASSFRVSAARSTISIAKLTEDFDHWTFDYGTIESKVRVDYIAPPGTPPADIEIGFIQNVLPSSVVRYRYAGASSVSSIACPGKLLDASNGAAVWARTWSLNGDQPLRALKAVASTQHLDISLKDTPHFNPCKFRSCIETNPALLHFEATIVMQTWAAARLGNAPAGVLSSYRLLAATDPFTVHFACDIRQGRSPRQGLPPVLAATMAPETPKQPIWNLRPPLASPVVAGSTSNEVFVRRMSDAISAPHQ